MAVHGQDSAGGGMLCYGFWGFLAASKENSAVRDPRTPTNYQLRFPQCATLPISLHTYLPGNLRGNSYVMHILRA